MRTCVFRCAFAVLALASLSEGARAQSVQGSAKQARAVRVAPAAIDVDGRLDETAWTEAPALTDFVQKEPAEGAAPSEPMEVRFLYDDDALYVGARMRKAAGSHLQAPMGRRDRAEQAEAILIALDTFLDRRTAYVFGVTASGVRIDRYHPRDDESAYDEGYDPVWEAKTSSDERGWTAELWIPFSQLRFNAQDRLVWGLNINRFTPTLNEDDYWVAVPRTVTAWSSRFGELHGLRDLKSTRRIEVLPYVAASSTVNGGRDRANPFDSGANLGNRFGADLKMGVGPSLTLDATFNPDFGQVEADPAEVNLTAFETFFTEKRQFFTEGAGLLNLAAVNNFFYSRRVGAAPVRPVSADFVDYPQTSTIIGAAKLTGRMPSGTSIGMFSAVTGSETARIFNRSSPAVTTMRVAPRSEFALARVQQEFGRDRSTVSGMVTFVHRGFADDDVLAALLVRKALAVAGDSTLRFKGGQYELTTYGGSTVIQGDAAAVARVQRSNVHYAQRPDRDYARYDPARTSMAGYKAGAIVRRTGGRHWIWNVTNDIESPGFETNDIGRLSAGDGIQLRTDVRYRETVPGRLFRSYWIGLVQNNEWNYGGGRQANTAQLYTSQTWNNFWTTHVSYTTRFRTQDARLTRGGPTMQVPFGGTFDFQLRGRPSGQTGWSAQYTHGWSEDGGLTDQFQGSVTFRPGPRWQISINPDLLRQIDSQQYVATIDSGRPDTYGRRYVFGRIDRTTYAIQGRVGYTLRPDVNVDAYVEPFAASGRYSSLGELALPGTRQRLLYGTGGTTATRQADGSIVVTDGGSTFRLANNDFNVHSFRSNIVLRWEYRPGSTLYLVWQQSRRLSETLSDRVGLIDPFRSLTAPGSNYFVIKTSFWLPVR